MIRINPGHIPIVLPPWRGRVSVSVVRPDGSSDHWCEWYGPHARVSEEEMRKEIDAQERLGN